MKIQLISDTHLDAYEDNGLKYIQSLNPNEDELTLIIAGDLAGPKINEYLLKIICKRYTNVVFVPGNHDYWGSNFEKVDYTLRSLTDKILNLHNLNYDIVKIDGVRILGATLWFRKTPMSPIYNIGWSNFQEISNEIKEFYKANTTAKNFFYREIEPGDIVVTHHLPSKQSSTPEFRAWPTNIFYSNDLEKLIEEKKPALWCHGHAHSSSDYTIGETRILCNPRGYAHRMNRNFNENLIITK